MSEQGPASQRLAEGLSHELAIVSAAQLLILNNEAGARSGSFDDLVSYVDELYGLDGDVTAEALDIAEARVLRGSESNGEA